MEHDRELDAERLRPSVVLRLPAADHDDCEAVLPVLALESSEVGEKRVARPALGVAEDEQYTPPALVGERDGPTGKIRQLESRRGNAGLQSPLDQALGEGTLARQAPSTTGGFLCEFRNLTRADGDGFAIRCRSSRR